MSKKVLVIGIDGASPSLINDLVRQNKLVPFRKLMERGSFGVLQSTLPPISPVAWTSFGTGCDPIHHGIHDFFVNAASPGDEIMARRSHVKSEYLWHMVSATGDNCIVIDVPVTYPPIAGDLEGFILSRDGAPNSDARTAFPKGTYYQLKKMGMILSGDTYDPSNMDGTFNGLLEVIKTNAGLARYLIKKLKWRLFVIVFNSIDRASHWFWSDKSKLSIVYSQMAEVITELVKMTDRETILFVVSDHGFRSVPYYFKTNEWLFQKNYLRRTELNGDSTTEAIRKNLTSQKVKYEIDYRATRAYLQSNNSYGIRINLKGRDRYGIVESSEYAELCEKLIGDLRRLTNPFSGKQLFDKVKRRGGNLPVLAPTDSPDILLSPRCMETRLRADLSQENHLIGRNLKGYSFHDSEGIIFAFGPGIRKGLPFSANITDVAPTILSLLGIERQCNWDGHAIEEILIGR